MDLTGLARREAANHREYEYFTNLQAPTGEERQDAERHSLARRGLVAFFDLEPVDGAFYFGEWKHHENRESLVAKIQWDAGLGCFITEGEEVCHPDEFKGFAEWHEAEMPTEPEDYHNDR